MMSYPQRMLLAAVGVAAFLACGPMSFTGRAAWGLSREQAPDIDVAEGETGSLLQQSESDVDDDERTESPHVAVAAVVSDWTLPRARHRRHGRLAHRAAGTCSASVTIRGPPARG